MCRLATVAIVTLLAALGGPARSDILIGVASPMTGPQSWGGEQFERAAEMAVADLNAKGGVLGHSVGLIIGDDFCDPDQAVALARKLVSDGVVFVAGHRCSHSSISAAKVYEDAKIPMISPGSASARLTDEGGPNVFRLWGRDDQQGAMVGDYLAEHWAAKEIAILDDGTVWGLGVANAVRRTLRERGVRVAVDETLTPGEVDYSPLVSQMQAGSVDVFFLGGYLPETGLIFRQAHDRGYDVQLIASSAVATADLPLIAGPALEGSVMIATADMRTRPEAAEVVGRFRAQGYEPLGNTLYVYAAVQVWAQSVAAAGSLDPDAVIGTMHSREFDTVLGKIGFDAKGDVTGFEPWQWFVWQADGTYLPLHVAVKE